MSESSRQSAKPRPPWRRFKLTVAYDGSAFHGWQKQNPPGEPPMRTVQQVLDYTLMRLLAQPVKTVGASRTDAGVHARGQVCHFDASTPIPIDRLLMALNQKLPADVEARDIRVTDLDFHAVTGVRTKQYEYRLWTSLRKPLALRKAVYHCWTPLDVERMNDAASRLVGTHDFAGFSAAGHGRQTTVRRIDRCDLSRGWFNSAGSARSTEPTDPPTPAEFADADALAGCLVITVEGTGFLYNMVRIIAGTLVEVGRRKVEPSVIDQVIATTDRRLAGPTLPASGLSLSWIDYGSR